MADSAVRGRLDAGADYLVRGATSGAVAAGLVRLADWPAGPLPAAEVGAAVSAHRRNKKASATPGGK